MALHRDCDDQKLSVWVGMGVGVGVGVGLDVDVSVDVGRGMRVTFARIGSMPGPR